MSKNSAWDIAYPWVEDGTQAKQLAEEIEAYVQLRINEVGHDDAIRNFLRQADIEVLPTESAHQALARAFEPLKELVECPALYYTSYSGDLDKGENVKHVQCICCAAERGTLHNVKCHIGPAESVLGKEKCMAEQREQTRARIFAQDICRELYDRFAMGGWEPIDAHNWVIEQLQEFAQAPRQSEPTGNYVCDDEVFPKTVTFDNGRVVSLAKRTDAEGYYLTISPKKEYPKPCDVCGGVIQSEGDLDWHGYGNCRDIPEAIMTAPRQSEQWMKEAKEEQTMWFHGTTAENVESIRREGFREGTWFARHMEDAVVFGGPYVFFVKVCFGTRVPLDWQACSANALPASLIDKVLYVAASPSLAAPKEPTAPTEERLIKVEEACALICSGCRKGYKYQAGTHQNPIVHEKEEERAYHEGRWFDCRAEEIRLKFPVSP